MFIKVLNIFIFAKRSLKRTRYERDLFTCVCPTDGDDLAASLSLGVKGSFIVWSPDQLKDEGCVV
jgi:hypothetical protein